MEQPPALPPVEAGPVQLWPFLILRAEGTDNLFYQPGDAPPTSAKYTWTQPGVLLVLPFSHSSTRFSGGLIHKDYHDPKIAPGNTYGLLSDTMLTFSSGAYAELRADYEDGVLEAERFDPAVELPFTNQSYFRGNLAVEAGHERPGGHKISVRATARSTRFTGDRSSGFYDEDLRRADLTGLHALSFRSWFVWDAALQRADQSRPEAPSFPADRRSIRGETLRAGARVEFRPQCFVDARLGAANNDYAAPVPSRFRGLVGNVTAILIAPQRFSITASAIRDIYPSIYEDSNYYVSNQVGLSGANNPAARMSLGGTLSYYVNDYPTAANRRRDRSWLVEAWVGYRPRPWVEVRLSGRLEKRRSISDVFGFDVHRISLSLRTGI